MMYEVYESIGNFAVKVFESDNYYEVQDYLFERFEESEEEDEELFFSYFSIQKVA